MGEVLLAAWLTSNQLDWVQVPASAPSGSRVVHTPACKAGDAGSTPARMSAPIVQWLGRRLVKSIIGVQLPVWAYSQDF